MKKEEKPKNNQENFAQKRVLGIDYGTKSVGFASCYVDVDPYPTPLYSLPNTGEIKLIEQIRKIISDEAIEVVVLGLPLYLDGKESKMTAKVKEFALLLKNDLKNIPLYLQDETLTSYEANDRMKNSPIYNFKVDPSKVDQIAASIILEDFLKSSAII